VLLSIGTVGAVVTSQGRGVIVAAFVMVLAFAALTVSPSRLVPTLAGLAVAGVVTIGVISAVSGNSDNPAAFSRYESIAPTKLFETTSKDRGGALTIVPTYIRDYPLGHGLGTGGPAAGFGGGERVALSAESEFAFLVLEAGVIGLIIVVGFMLRLLALALTRIRRISDPELRTLLAAIAAPLFGIFALFVSGAPTSGSPLAPYLWFTAGVLAYWLISANREIQPAKRPMRRDDALAA
jgi:O-antigen ligase